MPGRPGGRPDAPPRMRCVRGHNLARYQIIYCRIHGEHRRYVCPMRSGNRRCGDVVTVPPVEPSCPVNANDEEDD